MYVNFSWKQNFRVSVYILLQARRTFWFLPITIQGFPGSSVGKESACNAGDAGSIPGLGRFPGEGKGYSLQYSGLEKSTDCIVQGGHKVSDTTG